MHANKTRKNKINRKVEFDLNDLNYIIKLSKINQHRIEKKTIAQFFGQTFT